MEKLIVTAATAATGVLRWGLGGIAAEQSIATGDDTPDRNTGLRVVGEGCVTHALLNFKSLFGLRG